MRNRYLTYSHAVIGDDDPSLVGKAQGLISDGLVTVRPAHELSLSESNEGAARVSVMLADLERERQRLAAEKLIVNESAAEVARRLEERSGHQPNAQEIFDEITRQERARDTVKKAPPKTVSRNDMLGIGEHAEAIAKGITRVV